MSASGNYQQQGAQQLGQKQQAMLGLLPQAPPARGSFQPASPWGSSCAHVYGFKAVWLRSVITWIAAATVLSP